MRSYHIYAACLWSAHTKQPVNKTVHVQVAHGSQKQARSNRSLTPYTSAIQSMSFARATFCFVPAC